MAKSITRSLRLLLLGFFLRRPFALVVVGAVLLVKVAVVFVIDVAAMLHCGVAAVFAVLVRVIGVYFMLRLSFGFLRSLLGFLLGCHG